MSVLRWHTALVKLSRRMNQYLDLCLGYIDHGLGLNMRVGAQSWSPEIMVGKVKAHEWCGNALVFTF